MSDEYDKARRELEGSFVRLINVELASDNPLRFQRAAKLCLKAHGVLQIYSTRVDSALVEDNDENIIADDGANRFTMMQAPHQVRILGQQRQMPAEDIIREAIAIVQPLLQAQAAEANERRLSWLVQLRADLIQQRIGTSFPVVDQRIQAMLDDLSQETSHAVDMDDPKLLRRHSAGDGERQADEDDRGQGHSEGAGSAGTSPSNGA